MRLVYLSPVPWASFAQRPQKFVEWFHRRYGEPVVWIEPYPTRFPRISDLRRLGAAPEAAVTVQPDWLTVHRPMALPLEPLPGSSWLNRGLWGRMLRDLGPTPASAHDVLVIGKPSTLALQLLGMRRWHSTVYDAMDNFPAFYSGISRMAMARRELQLVKAVGRVWASSTALRDRWQRHTPAIELVRNALDARLLPSVAAAPRKQRQRPRVLGYVGTLADWFDWDWLLALANARPTDVIRIIGPVFSGMPKHPLPSNIEMLPPCAHAEALQAMSVFDVGLIPFKRTELTAYVDPIKYYEYRAMGLPVLSTDFGEMHFHQREPGVFIADASSVAAQADQALTFVDEGERAAFVRINTWEARFDRVRDWC